MPSWPAMLLGSLLLVMATTTVAQWKNQEPGTYRRTHKFQHGQCSYTFVLPEPKPCPPQPKPFRGSNSLQRDSGASTLRLGDMPSQRMQQLEKMLKNNTQWLQKLERYIQMDLRSELAQAQQHKVQNQTATILELGTNLLSQTTSRTRKLTDVETQVTKVLNRTSYMELQLLETSLSTDKMEKQLDLQEYELHQLQGRNSELEKRLEALEIQQETELADIRGQREQLQNLLGRQSSALAGLQRSLGAASRNSSHLQLWHHQLLESVQRLVGIITQGSASMKAGVDQVFEDCAEIQRFGINASGVYTIRVSGVTEPLKVFCDMETSGGGWTLIQRRENGRVNFHRKWKDYKQGFGNPAGEHWLGNEVVHQLTSRAAYSLRVELQDWEGNETYAQYEHFQLGSEEQLYRLSLSGYSGSAGPKSSIDLQGANFSTQDSDNDKCSSCKCAHLLSGGWWFDSCGLSNLNGIYYPAGHHLRKLSGIRWQYFRGPSYSLRATRMMMRPVRVQ